MTISIMTRILVVGLLVLATSNARAVTPASIEILRTKRTYPSGRSCDLRQVDFRNFTYFEGEWMGTWDQPSPDDPVHVVHGKYSLREQSGFEDVVVEDVRHPDLGRAVVSLSHSYGGGSSNQELVVMIFQCVDGKLTNTQLVHGDGHGQGTGVFLSNGGRKMTMNSVYDYSTGHCCPRYLETAVFRLAEGGFVLVATHQKENQHPGH